MDEALTGAALDVDDFACLPDYILVIGRNPESPVCCKDGRMVDYQVDGAGHSVMGANMARV